MRGPPDQHEDALRRAHETEPNAKAETNAETSAGSDVRHLSYRELGSVWCQGVETVWLWRQHYLGGIRLPTGRLR